MTITRTSYDWKLLRGSHEFPGPAGGTCINEAAIIAAGFEYRRVRYAGDCPPCFSRALADYAIHLNDWLPDDARQRLLMPFVLRLPGTADRSEIEMQRMGAIRLGILRDVVSVAIEPVSAEIAEIFRGIQNFPAAIDALRAAQSSIVTCHDSTATASLSVLGVAIPCKVLLRFADFGINAIPFHHRKLWYAARAAMHEAAVAVLDQAMRIGRQADPIDIAAVRARVKETV